MLQPFSVAGSVLDTYRQYIRASFPLRDEVLDSQREALIDEHDLLWRDAFVSLARPGATGPSLSSLEGLIEDQALAIPWGFANLYAHQHEAIQRLAPNRPGGPANTLILSGTGSGKTESFLIPIVDACIRDSRPGIKALIIYPMNALANDQLHRLQALLAGTAVTFGRYTGDSPELDAGDGRRRARPRNAPANMVWSRQAMRESPPNILLTNYTQLEYILLRGKDAELFRHGPPQYLVVDEIHLFTGVLGAEVGCLLRRLREHTGAKPDEICAVGTSATAGIEERARLSEFAGRLFGAPFDEGALIEEKQAPFVPKGATVLSSPTITREDLHAAHDNAGLARLAKKTLGVEIDEATFGESLGTVIDEFATVGVVEEALDKPGPLSVAAKALAALPERKEVPAESLELEAAAIVLLGAAATQQPVGEQELIPRFRPRLHQVVRSLAGLWRCLRPSCGRLLPPGTGVCPECQASARPLATCRTCGEAYWVGRVESTKVEDIHRIATVEPQRGDKAIFLADPNRLDPIDIDESGNAIDWKHVTLCSSCTRITAGPALTHARACPTPLTQGISFLASTDNVHCPSCGDQGAAGRPILLPLKGSAAASVAVLTQSLSDELRIREGEAGGRLLVFADSRQDAAQQAGYADDQGARVSIRQLARAALHGEAMSFAALVKTVRAAVIDDAPTLRRWLIGESDRRFDEVSDPLYQPSEEDERHLGDQIEWELDLEFTERARRRFSLEREGLVVVDVDRIAETAAAVLSGWNEHPFKSEEHAAELVHAVIDVMRYARAVDQYLLTLMPNVLRRDRSIRIGDRAVQSTRGWADSKFIARGIDIRGWSGKGVTRMIELLGRVLEGSGGSKPTDVVERFASRLIASGLLTKKPVEKRIRYMVDHKRLLLSLRSEEPLYKCDRCGSVRSTLLTSVQGKGLCINWRCPGTPQPFEPAKERSFYRRQYESAPRRLIVREHSGQIESDERIALEQRFNDPQSPTVDVIACTPTLEVGVSLDDLHAIILRNLPPTPANYAQRVGRAGRRSKVALAFAHAGHGPHDSYYFEQPREMIQGLVRAPSISLENEPLLKRHINSLIFEVLGIDLPSYWVPPDEDESFSEETIADTDGVIKESTLRPFQDALTDDQRRRAVRDAVLGAFDSALDPSPPPNADAVATKQIEEFTENLRAALNRWCERYRALLDEWRRTRTAMKIPTKFEEESEKRLLYEIKRMSSPRNQPEQQPLGFLGMVGFLPRYGFSGNSVMLHPPLGEEPITQSGGVAVTEFAPGNTIYARGRRLKVQRLDPPPAVQGEAAIENRENLVRFSRRCDECEFLTLDPLEKSCPSCGNDLQTQTVLELTGVRGSGGAISSDDEYRARSYYDVAHILGIPPEKPEVVTLGGMRIERSAQREITIANRGPARKDEEQSIGFDICTGCGYARETQDSSDEDGEKDEPEESRGHAARCPGRNDPGGEIVRQRVWLTARIQGDVMEIVLPEATRQKDFYKWRLTLAEALKLGIRESMQAGQRDLSSFERLKNGEPYSICIFDTMPGGTGYIPKLFANGAEGLKIAAATVLQRIENCSCTGSCHRCLREFWNQRIHESLDRFEVLGVLRRLAEGHATPSLDPENEQLESFLEVEFFKRLKAAGLPTPTLQVVRELGGPRIQRVGAEWRENGRKGTLITRVDAEYREPDVSIFLDGRAYHTQSEEKITDDLDKRNALEAKGILVLEFTYQDVMARFDSVIEAIERALKGTTEDPELDPKSVAGLTVTSIDESNRSIEASVDAIAWARQESFRQKSLASANRLRLAGWRLGRNVA